MKHRKPAWAVRVETEHGINLEDHLRRAAAAKSCPGNTIKEMAQAFGVTYGKLQHFATRRGIRFPRTGGRHVRYPYVGSRWPEHHGKTFTVAEWTEIQGGNVEAVRRRVWANGGVITDPQPEKAIYTYRGREFPRLDGHEFSVAAFSVVTGLTEEAVRYRIKLTGGEYIPDAEYKARNLARRKEGEAA